VRAYVIRCECAELGRGHLDTAAAAHNLGCVLDALGKSSRAQQLLTEASEVLSRQLGPHHPRALIAARNLSHVRHKAVKLPVNKQALTELVLLGGSRAVNAAAGAAGGGGGGGDQGTGGSPSRQPKNGTAAGGTGAGGSTSAQSGFKERLSAVVAARQQPGQRLSPTAAARKQQPGQLKQQQAGGGAASSSSRSAARILDYTDLDYIGGGLHQAGGDVRALYERCRADIAAHAAGGAVGRGAAAPRGGGGGGEAAAVVELQVRQGGVWGGEGGRRREGGWGLGHARHQHVCWVGIGEGPAVEVQLPEGEAWLVVLYCIVCGGVPLSVV
jgi:hypothetical protein